MTLPCDIPDLVVRTYRKDDQSAVSRLYTEGLLAGQLAPNDTGADVENIHAAYFDSERHAFWVAQHDDRVVGMIGVGSDEHDTAEIRRLRVEKPLQGRGIGTRLLETALDHCRKHGYLKVRLDTRFEKSTAVDMFDRVGFQHHRSRTVHDKDQLEFYLDLYREPRKDKEDNGKAPPTDCGE